MKIPLHLFVSLSLLFLSGVAMFHVKFQVQNLSKDMVEIQKQILQEKSEIKVLNAEWSYLNQPERLRKIVVQYYPALKPIDVAQLGFKKYKSTPEVITEFAEENAAKTVVNVSFKIQNSSYSNDE